MIANACHLMALVFDELQMGNCELMRTRGPLLVKRRAIHRGAVDIKKPAFLSYPNRTDRWTRLFGLEGFYLGSC
jgi:hypothetical protein